jgi:hypothetical protein
MSDVLYTRESLAQLSISKLVELYNAKSDSPVKSFRDKTTAVDRVLAVLVVFPPEDEAPDFSEDGDNPVDPTEDAEDFLPEAVAEEPSSSAEDAGENLPAADAGWAIPSRKSAAPAVRKRGPVQRNRPEGAVPTGRSIHSEEDTIQVLVTHNPKKAGSATHARFAFYENGMTVKEFLDLCEATGHFAHRHLYRADLRWDEKQGYIKVVPKVVSE